MQLVIAARANAEPLAALQDEHDRLRSPVASYLPVREASAPAVTQESNAKGTSGGASLEPGPLNAYPHLSHDVLTDLQGRFKRQCWECRYGECVRQKNSWKECRIPKGLQGVGSKKRALGHDGPDFDIDSRGLPPPEARAALKNAPLPARARGHRICHKCQKSSALQCTCFSKRK